MAPYTGYADWQGLDREGLVWTYGDGSPIHPKTISNRFLKLSAGAGLPRIRLHDVRHSYASAAHTRLGDGLARGEGDQPAARARNRGDHAGHLLARAPGGG